MLDLRQFLGSGATTSGRANTRSRGGQPPEIPAGLMVDEVLGFRRFVESDFNAEPPPTVIPAIAYSRAPFRRWRLRYGQC